MPRTISWPRGRSSTTTSSGPTPASVRRPASTRARCTSSVPVREVRESTSTGSSGRWSSICATACVRSTGAKDSPTSAAPADGPRRRSSASRSSPASADTAPRRGAFSARSPRSSVTNPRSRASARSRVTRLGSVSKPSWISVPCPVGSGVTVRPMSSGGPPATLRSSPGTPWKSSAGLKTFTLAPTPCSRPPAPGTPRAPGRSSPRKRWCSRTPTMAAETFDARSAAVSSAETCTRRGSTLTAMAGVFSAAVVVRTIIGRAMTTSRRPVSLCTYPAYAPSSTSTQLLPAREPRLFRRSLSCGESVCVMCTVRPPECFSPPSLPPTGGSGVMASTQ